jgi:hypothetical protein
MISKTKKNYLVEKIVEPNLHEVLHEAIELVDDPFSCREVFWWLHVKRERRRDREEGE